MKRMPTPLYIRRFIGMGLIVAVQWTPNQGLTRTKSHNAIENLFPTFGMLKSNHSMKTGQPPWLDGVLAQQWAVWPVQAMLAQLWRLAVRSVPPTPHCM